MTQTIDNLRGEIEFREKLSRQHVSGEILLPDYYAKEAHDQILRERVDTTHRRMKDLADQGITFSPFLELGAERGQRSLVLTNDFGASGVAIDISYHQLRTMEYFSKLFRKNRLPLRICCDANHLPFKNNAFAFVFGYQFLHHFPSLKPVVQELHRVLGNGYFYFDEEPFKRILKIVLYRQKKRQYSQRAIRENRYIEFIGSFISEPWRDEVEHGIIENNDITLAEWNAALAIFGERDLNLCSVYNVSSKFSGRLSVKNIPNYFLGGTINGLCRKAMQASLPTPINIIDLLACPSCTISSDDAEVDRPSLVRESDHFRCPQCRVDYPCRDGILFLLPKEELWQLYPDFV